MAMAGFRFSQVAYALFGVNQKMLSHRGMYLLITWGILLLCVVHSTTRVCGASIREVLSQESELHEARSFAEQSGVLKSIAAGSHGRHVMIMIPDNKAWRGLSDSRRKYLLDPDNQSDLESLLLFCSTDSVIRRRDAKQEETIVTLLGTEAIINPDESTVDVLDPITGEIYDSANILRWDITSDDGIIHVIDRVMFPTEMLESPNFPPE